ncbi:MAG: Maf family protein [Chloroflexota bacterium]
MTTTFILASQSPRRHQLMGLLDAHIVTQVSGANEDVVPGQTPADYVTDVARRKAKAVAELPHPNTTRQAFIIAADTTVAVDGDILGKPASDAEAYGMLQRLCDRTHEVHTGLCVIDLASGREISEVQTTHVTMRSYSDAEIQAYIATGDPLDKAGAYAIQHTGFHPVIGLDGCYLSVVGLSLCHLISVLIRLNASVSVDMDALIAAHGGFGCSLLDALQLDPN